jgi:hypothetical protein
MKRKMSLTKIVFLGVALFFSGIVYGQKGVEDGSRFGKGADSIACLRNTSLYREYVKQKNYGDAVKFWRRAFRDCPLSSKNLYLDGVRIYKEFQEKELDGSKREAYIDTILMIYDQRVKYDFGSEPFVNQYKGLDLLAMRSDNTEALKDVYSFFKVSIKGLGKKTIKPVFQNFLKVGVSLYNQGELDAVVLIEDYLYTLDILESDNEQKLIDEINDQMIGSGAVSCDQIIEIYTPKFEANPDDLKLMVTITNFLDKLNCRDSELYYKALSKRHSLDASPESAFMLGQLAHKKELYDDALKYLQEAIEKETDNMKKSAMYLQLAHATNKKGNKAEARSLAYKSIEMDPGTGEPYMFIASLYAESGSECSGLTLPNAIYWAAIDKFVKAKSVDPSVADKANQSIEIYSKYYPNKEEAFFHGVKEGDKYYVECWINETTTARFGN